MCSKRIYMCNNFFPCAKKARADVYLFHSILGSSRWEQVGCDSPRSDKESGGGGEVFGHHRTIPDPRTPEAQGWCAIPTRLNAAADHTGKCVYRTRFPLPALCVSVLFFLRLISPHRHMVFQSQMADEGWPDRYIDRDCERTESVGPRNRRASIHSHFFCNTRGETWCKTYKATTE